MITFIMILMDIQLNTFPGSITSIGTDVFSQCSGLTSLTIAGSVSSIGFSVFAQCRSLTAVTIPDAVESIRNYAFYECSGLSSETICKSVASIGVNAFGECVSLTKVYCNAMTLSEADKGSFSDNALNGTLYVPKGSKSAYELAEVWENF